MHINLDELASHIQQLPNTLATFAHPDTVPAVLQMLTTSQPWQHMTSPPTG